MVKIPLANAGDIRDAHLISGLGRSPGGGNGNPLQARILEWVAIPFSRGSSQLGIEPRSPALQADSICILLSQDFVLTGTADDIEGECLFY